MSTKIDYKKMKNGGFIIQSDPKYFTIRTRIPAGQITSKQMTSLAEITEKFGQGMIHLTTRQGFQIPWVNFKSLNDIADDLENIGLPPGSCGPRVRNVMSCVGLKCQNALVDTYKIAETIDEKYFGMELPGKIKIAVTGCPNSCAKPQLNDIGIMGVVKPRVILEKCDGCALCEKICKEDAINIVDKKVVVDYEKCIYCGACIQICPKDAKVADISGYTIFVGVNVGRHPRFADKLTEFVDESIVFKIIDRSMNLFKDEAKPLERFGAMIDRIGLDEFKKAVFTEEIDSKEFEDKEPQETLKWAIEQFHPRIRLASSFGPEDIVLIHMARKIQPEIEIFFLDTSYHFKETIELKDRLKNEWNLNLLELSSEMSIEAQNEKYGEKLYESDPNQCCNIRKVEPLE